MIRLVNGDTPIKKVTVTDSSDTPVDLTSIEIILSVKKRVNDTTYIFQCTDANSGIVKTNATAGEFEIRFKESDTINLSPGDYVYDIQFRDTSNGTVTTVVGPAKFTVIKGVTD